MSQQLILRGNDRDRQSFEIRPRTNPQWRAVTQRAVEAIWRWAESGNDLSIRLSELLRTLDQNAAMWPALTDICKQIPLVVQRRDGTTRPATNYDWKDVLTAAFEEETEWVPGLRGGMVMLGARTSQYGKRKMYDFLEFIHGEFADRVTFSESAKDKLAEMAPQRRRAA